MLLHACCAPCSSAIVEWMLSNDVRPVIYYFNPNIWPREEYEIRKQESKRHAESLGLQWIDGDYDHDSWLQGVCGLEGALDPEGRFQNEMAKEPERGRRCERCFVLRLTAAAKKAQELGIPYFTTTLASSRWKSLDQINRAGELAEKAVNDQSSCIPSVASDQRSITKFKVQCHYWSQNWRKGGLYERRNQLLKEFCFYNQQYCGCEFSMRNKPAEMKENAKIGE